MIRLLHPPGRDLSQLAWWPDCVHLLEPVAASDAEEPLAEIERSPYLRLNGDGLELVDRRFSGGFCLKAEEVDRHAKSTSFLCRAAGVIGVEFRVLDMFAGFGVDGLALARHADVTLVEQNPIAFVLLREFADRLGIRADIRLGDGPEELSKAITSAYEVVYLDPMFPIRNKKALPNRGMQHLRALDVSEPYSEAGVTNLIELARGCALDRVVLKRRLRDPQIGKPNFSLKGRTVRFDVYR